MDDAFDITIQYKGNEKILKGILITYGYSYKIQVDIDGEKIFFEPDEERNFRAMSDPENRTDAKQADPELLRSITEAIQEILR